MGRQGRHPAQAPAQCNETEPCTHQPACARHGHAGRVARDHVLRAGCGEHHREAGVERRGRGDGVEERRELLRGAGLQARGAQAAAGQAPIHIGLESAFPDAFLDGCGMCSRGRVQPVERVGRATLRIQHLVHGPEKVQRSRRLPVELDAVGQDAPTPDRLVEVVAVGSDIGEVVDEPARVHPHQVARRALEAHCRHGDGRPAAAVQA